MAEEGTDALFPEIAESTRSAIDFYTERFEAISDSAVGLFRINLVIVGLFLPIISGLLDPANTNFSPSDVFNNPITQVGLFVWTLSMIATMATQYYARRYSISQYTPFQEFLKDPDSGELQPGIADSIEYYGFRVRYASKALSGCFILSFIAVGLLAVGFIDPFVDFRPTKTFLVVAGLIVTSLAVGVGFIGILRVGVSPQAFLAGLDLVAPIFNTLSYQVLGQTIYRTTWDQLTQVRRSLLQTIAEEIGQKEFTRSDLEQAIRVATLTAPIPAETVSTALLERLVEDNYLVKVSGPDMPLVVDTQAGENEIQVAVLGSEDLQELIEQVVERENLELAFSEVSPSNTKEIIRQVNSAVGEQVLILTETSNKYKLSDEALEILDQYFNVADEDGNDNKGDD